MQRLDSTLFHWRGATVLLSPQKYAFVYLLHFHQLIGNKANPRAMAGHYLGSTEDLEARLSRHIHGNGSALMAAVARAGVTWEVSRLWRFSTGEQARAFERKLKKTGHSPRQCYLCNKRQVIDPLTFMRQGHSPILSRQPAKRQPMSNCQPPRFVRRCQS